LFGLSLNYAYSSGFTSIVSYFIYFGHMVIIISAVTLATAAVGFFASFAFVKRIYSSIEEELELEEASNLN
jgi:hypothetical protein